MDENKNLSISYLAFESSQARMERVNQKLWIVILVLIVALVGSNAGWIWYESQWNYVDTTTQTIQQEATSDGDGAITIQGIGGDYFGGESKTDNNNNDN